MVNVIIDGVQLSVEENTTILNAAKLVGVHIPTLCYFEGLNEIGACRVCVVEIAGSDRLVAACDNPVQEGMVIFTNSDKARAVRKTNVELILSQHDCRCAVCVRSGNCSLQKLANDLGLSEPEYDVVLPKQNWPKSFPLQRDATKCIKCMRCIQVCDQIQEMHIWDVSGTGSRTTVDVAQNKEIKESNCTLCGQCITHCPVGALRERDDVGKVLEALADQGVTTMIQVAPAIRTAWGESLGVSREFATAQRLVGALRHIGFDLILDTVFSADLTIMEEGSEFLERLHNREKYSWPMFTSCCPGWIRFVKSQYPEFIPNVSTAKSPQQMFGAVTKTYYAKHFNLDPKKICSISVMPCLAKKAECALPTMGDPEYGQDVDIVLTNRELVRLIRSEHMVIPDLPEEEFDDPAGDGSGAGVIFGATGGVMEAALRSAYYLATGENPDPDAFRDVRGDKGWKEATFYIKDLPVRVAVVSGLGNTRRLMQAVAAGKVEYDFVEVMACPGGCAGGGGQPIWDGQELAAERGEVLYGLDKISDPRFSHENPAVQKAYEEFFGAPLSPKAHHLLHTNHNGWKMPKEDNPLDKI